ncbi:MAG TPA: hypothetical protein VM531_04060, partial [Sphingomicrobium sp.]|nr:hypothetical protein [Sphingomicrobium sp.]
MEKVVKFQRLVGDCVMSNSFLASTACGLILALSACGGGGGGGGAPISTPPPPSSLTPPPPPP